MIISYPLGKELYAHLTLKDAKASFTQRLWELKR
jgi:hypothetical protein